MDFLTKKDNRLIFYLILITLTVSPAAFQSDIDDRNYLLIGAMGLGFVLLLFSHSYNKKIDNTLIFLICLMFGFQCTFHLQNIRFSSIFFTCMFFFYFMLAIRVFNKGKPTNLDFLIIIKGLIYAYLIVLVIQQFCVLVGLPIFNESNISAGEKWKLNALSAEPSHTSRFVGILMYAYLSLKDTIANKQLSLLESFKSSRNVWIAFLWIMLTTVSGTAMMVLVLILSRYVSKRMIWIGAALLVVIIGIAAQSEITALARFARFSSAAVTLSADKMIEADHSASVRIVPALLCISKINPFSISGWIGTGMGNVSTWLSYEMPGLKEGAYAGGMAAFTLEYGLIISIVYLAFSFRLCYDNRYKFSSIGLWVICCVLIGINSQIGWCCITFLYLSKQYNRQQCVQKYSMISRNQHATDASLALKSAR